MSVNTTQVLLSRGIFSEAEQELGSTLRELIAVFHALDKYKTTIHNRCIRIFTDNSGVVACLKSMYSKSESIRYYIKLI